MEKAKYPLDIYVSNKLIWDVCDGYKWMNKHSSYTQVMAITIVSVFDLRCDRHFDGSGDLENCVQNGVIAVDFCRLQRPVTNWSNGCDYVLHTSVSFFSDGQHLHLNLPHPPQAKAVPGSPRG